jgi:hypothetical protein
METAILIQPTTQEDIALALRIKEVFNIELGNFDITRITVEATDEYPEVDGKWTQTVAWDKPLPFGLVLPEGWHAEMKTTADGACKTPGNMTSAIHIPIHVATGELAEFIAIVGHEICHAITNHMVKDHNTVFSERVAFKHMFDTYMSFNMPDKALEVKNRGLNMWNYDAPLWGPFPPEYEIGWCLLIYNSVRVKYFGLQPLQLKGINI